MAYTKNTWQTGDIVSSAKLNHMEDGIADAGGVMVINDTNDTLDKTWQEIYDAMAQGKLCVVRLVMGEEPGDQISANAVTSVALKSGKYMVGVGANMNIDYSASSATDYPKMDSPK